ncbi:MAG TPA: polysaccharide deacetylase family protein [Kineosporiaceae bacterium]|nr:polysaccharide deacetylase family protein [Kineosporiaceae bacterium]
MDAWPSRRLVLGLAGTAAVGSSLAACGRDGSTAGGGATRTPSVSRSTAAAPAPATSATPGTEPSPAAGPDITHGPRTRQAVALTFHGDGPASIVQDVLGVLRRAKAQVTVLAIGRWLAARPSLAAMIRDAGHELGNHTWSHQTMPLLTAAQVRVEVDRAAQELDSLTGSPGRWFRPSGTPHSTPAIRAAAVAAGYGACLGYDVDPLDYTDPGPAALVRSLARSVRPGSIVSLHLGHPGTLAALPAVLAHLHDAGLAPVTASDLLGA